MKRQLILRRSRRPLAACGSDRIAAPRGGTAHLRLANASVEASQVDLRVDGQTVLSGISMAEVSGYADVVAGASRSR